MKLVVASNLPGVENAFEAAAHGISNFERSQTANGKTINLWDGSGMRRGGFGASWRVSRAIMFRTQGASAETPWPDYTDAEAQYAAIKGSILGRKVGKSTGDLNRWERGSERLAPSMFRRSHSEYVQDERPRSAAFGTAVPYASRLHAGIGRAPKGLGGATPPPRPLLGLGRSLKRDWLLDLTDFVSMHTAAIGVRASKAAILEGAAK